MAECVKGVDEVWIVREVAAWKALRETSAFVLDAVGYACVEEDMWMVYRKPRLGTLKDALVRNPEWDEWTKGVLMVGIAHGLATLHEHAIVHGHLTDDSIYLDAYMIPKLAGFHAMPILPEESQATLSLDVHAAGVLLWQIHWLCLADDMPHNWYPIADTQDAKWGALVHTCCKWNKEQVNASQLLRTLCERMEQLTPGQCAPTTSSAPLLTVPRPRAYTEANIRDMQKQSIDAFYSRNDFNAALELCKQLQEFDHPYAYHVTSLALYFGRGMARDAQHSNLLTMLPAFLGWRNAVHNMGIYYFNGTISGRQYDLAFKWFQRAADMQFGNAIASIAYCYEYGYGTLKDDNLAIAYYEKACARDSSTAYRLMALKYYNGAHPLIHKDMDKAAECIEKACRLQDSRSIRIAIEIYGDNYSKLYKLCYEGDALCISDASVVMGNFYRRTGDAERAMAYYRRAMDMGNSDAAYHLGTLLEALGRRTEASVCYAIAVYYRFSYSENELSPDHLQDMGGMDDTIYRMDDAVLSTNFSWRRLNARALYQHLTTCDYATLVAFFDAFPASCLWMPHGLKRHKAFICRRVEDMVNSTQYQYYLNHITGQNIEYADYPVAVSEIIDTLNGSCVNTITTLVEDQDIMTDRELEIFRGRIGDTRVSIDVGEFSTVIGLYGTLAKYPYPGLYARACLESMAHHGTQDSFHGHLLHFMVETDQLMRGLRDMSFDHFVHNLFPMYA
jgi:TPR repeat protein